MPKVTSSFEHSFRRALNAAKAGVQEGTTERKSPFTFGEETLVASISLHEPGRGRPRVYDFWQRAGLREGDLASLISVRGPASDQYGRDDGMKHLIAFVDGKGKITYQGKASGRGEKARVNRLYLDDAIEKFWKKMGFHRHEAQGWDVNINGEEGFAYITRRMPSGYSNEYAVVYAASPGRKLDVFVPDGSKPLTYEARFKIPTEIMNRIAQEFEGIWRNLVQVHHSSRVTTHPRGILL